MKINNIRISLLYIIILSAGTVFSQQIITLEIPKELQVYAGVDQTIDYNQQILALLLMSIYGHH